MIPKASTPDERTELARWLADRRGVSFDDCDLGEQAEWRWEAEAVISKLHEYTDTDEELAMANAYAKEGWAWVDDFCEALGDGTTVFNFKERIAQLLAALEAVTTERDEARQLRDEVIVMVDREVVATEAALEASERENERLAKIEAAAREIDREGYVDSMQNVPSWQRLAAALAPSTPPALREGE